MRFPSPEDMSPADNWGNHVAAGLATAALGLIPPEAVALGVRMEGTDLTVVIQVPRYTEKIEIATREIVDDLWTVLGEGVDITFEIDIREEPRTVVTNRFRWVFKRWDDEWMQDEPDD